MVAKQATRVQLTPSAASVQSGSPITLTIKVTSATSGTPTGDVTLFNEKEVLGVVTLSNGEGSLAIPALTATTSSLSAVYNGDTNYLSSTTANTAGVEVIPGVADFTIGSTTATTSTSIGAAAVFTITIGAAPGLPFNNPVVLTVTGLPAGMSSTFNPQMVTPADGTVTSAMSVIPYLDLRSRNERQLPYGAIATCLLLPLLGIRRVRRSIPKGLLYVLLLSGALGATTMLTGCGGGALRPTQGSYTLTITGTSGSVQHSTTVTLKLQ